MHKEIIQLWERIKSREKKLTEVLNRESLQFAGTLFDQLTSQDRLDFQRYIELRSGTESAKFDELVAITNKYETLSIIYLSGFLSDNYGTDKERGNAVYQYISKAIGAEEEIKNHQKKLLWESFTKACVASGLPISNRRSGPRYMVDTILYQGGIPKRDIPFLTTKMGKLAQKIGIPDIEDEKLLSEWRYQLIDSLAGDNRTIIKEVLEHDISNYYVSQFITSIAGNHREHQNPFNNEETKSLTKDNLLNEKSLKIPRLRYLNGYIGVHLPKLDDSRGYWTVIEESNEETVQDESAYAFVPLNDDLPTTVTLKNNDNTITIKKDIWIKEERSQVLIFEAEEGYYVASAHLQEEKSTNSITSLPPGEYILLSRVPPDPNKDNELNLEQVCYEPDIFQSYVQVLPGVENRTFTKSSYCLSLIGDSVSSIGINGIYHTSDNGVSFYSDEKLEIVASIPEGLATRDSAFQLEISYQNQVLTKDIIFKNLLESKTEISSWLKEINPHFGYLRIKLTKKGSTRALAKIRRLLWNGLEKVYSLAQIRVRNLPDNLENKEEIEFTAQTIKVKEPGSIDNTLHLEFGRKIPSLKWSESTVSMRLEKYKGQQLIESQIIYPGHLITYSNATYCRVIFQSKEEGTLFLGEYTKKVSPRRSLNLSLNAIRDQIVSQQDTLKFKSQNEAFDLIKFISTFEFQDITMKMPRNEDDSIEIYFTSTEVVEGITLEFEDILDSSKNSIVLNFNKLIISDESRCFYSVNESNNTFKYEVEITQPISFLPRTSLIRVNASNKKATGPVLYKTGKYLTALYVPENGYFSLKKEIEALSTHEKLSIIEQLYPFQFSSRDDAKYLNNIYRLLSLDLELNEASKRRLVKVMDSAFINSSEKTFVNYFLISRFGLQLFSGSLSPSIKVGTHKIEKNLEYVSMLEQKIVPFELSKVHFLPDQITFAINESNNKFSLTSYFERLPYVLADGSFSYSSFKLCIKRFIKKWSSSTLTGEELGKVLAFCNHVKRNFHDISYNETESQEKFILSVIEDLGLLSSNSDKENYKKYLLTISELARICRQVTMSPRPRSHFEDEILTGQNFNTYIKSLHLLLSHGYEYFCFCLNLWSIYFAINENLKK